MLDIQHLRVSYGITEVLRDVTFTVPQHKIVARLGGNGSGKTTLLNTLIGLVMRAAGSVKFEGVECAGLAPDKIVRRGIAPGPQGGEVWPSTSPVIPPATKSDTKPIANSIAVVKRMRPPHRVPSQLKVLTADGTPIDNVRIEKVIAE